MSQLIFGACANESADVGLIRKTGIDWVRQDPAMPFADRFGGWITV